MIYLSEYKYFVIKTDFTSTLILPNKENYNLQADDIFDVFIPSKEQNLEILKAIDYKWNIPITDLTINDDKALLEKLHKAIYEILGHEIKQFFVSILGEIKESEPLGI
jgi:hypothetical protein